MPLTFYTCLKFPTRQAALEQARERGTQGSRIAAAKMEAIALDGREKGIYGAEFGGGRLRAGLTPRLWYLAPGSELTGVLAAAEAE